MVPSFWCLLLNWVMFQTMASSSMVTPSLFVSTSRGGGGSMLRWTIFSKMFFSDDDDDDLHFSMSANERPLSTDVLELYSQTKRMIKRGSQFMWSLIMSSLGLPGSEFQITPYKVIDCYQIYMHVFQISVSILIKIFNYLYLLISQEFSEIVRTLVDSYKNTWNNNSLKIKD